jgi:hypothetical protein
MASSAASASALNVKATSSTMPQVWMKISLMNHHNDNTAIGHIYFDKSSNQITYMLKKHENWSAEWLAMYEDQHITVDIDHSADLVTYHDVARSIIRQSVHFNGYTIDPEDFTYGLSFEMLFSMTFAQYHAIKQNPELARFITMINDEAADAFREVNMKYRNLKAKSKEKQQQLTNEIAIAKQRISELKNTISELESAVKNPKKGPAKSWKYKGDQYYHDGDNNVWRQTIGGCEFVGVYIEEEDRIDEDADEPYYESEDESDDE